jgi:hypothetical protein
LIYIAGLRENLYGWFTVNLGVYVPEVALYSGEAGRFVQHFYCCIRTRLGNVGPEQQDLWWEIGADVDAEIRQRLASDALPYLDRFASRDHILREWADATEIAGAGGHPPRIVKAIMLAARGQVDEAHELLHQ